VPAKAVFEFVGKYEWIAMHAVLNIQTANNKECENRHTVDFGRQKES
jgi:hypothetical protein